MAHGPRGGPVGTAVLDDISKRIIEQLQADGRQSYAAIGKAVGLSEAAVRQRVQRLHETGVVSDGLSTTVLPAASAGAIFHMAIMSG